MSKYSIVVLILIGLLLQTNNTFVSAEEQPNNTFGGWEHIDVSHSINNSNWFVSLYFEHDNFQYKRLDLCFLGMTVGYKITKWLKVDAAYHLMIEPDRIAHRAVVDVTGSLKEGNFSFSLRERYQHKWALSSPNLANELRSKLKIQYAIPNSRFKPYIAIELFTWDKWLKTRHYVGTDVVLNKYFVFDVYYNYYLFASKPAEHVIGVGLAVSL